MHVDVDESGDAFDYDGVDVLGLQLVS